jgi:hypothetical protein
MRNSTKKLLKSIKELYLQEFNDKEIGEKLNYSTSSISRYRKDFLKLPKIGKLKSTKFCNNCLLVKPTIDFNWKQTSRNSKDSFCKECASTRGKLKAEQRKEKHDNDFYTLKELQYKCCGFCKETKPITDFYKAPRANDGYKHYCIECYDYRLPLKLQILNRLKARAISRNIEFDLLPKDLFLPTHCPILNIELKYSINKKEAQNAKFNDSNVASVDRIDNSKGYVPGNVIVISRLANTMKNKASFEEIELFCSNLVKLTNYYKTQGALANITDVFPHIKEYEIT